MAIGFDSSTSDTLVLDLASGNFVVAPPITLSAWVFPNNVSQVSGLEPTALWIGDRLVGNKAASIEIATAAAGDPARYFLHSGGGATTVNTTNGVTVNTWHHIAARSASQTDHRIVLDGNLAAAGASTFNEGNFVSVSNRIAVAERGDSTPTNFFDGRIAEVAIWSRALSDTQIVALSQGFIPPAVEMNGLFFYAPLYRTGEYTERMFRRVMVPQGTLTNAVHPPRIRRAYYCNPGFLSLGLPPQLFSAASDVGIVDLPTMRVLLQPRIGIRPGT